MKNLGVHIDLQQRRKRAIGKYADVSAKNTMSKHTQIPIGLY